METSIELTRGRTEAVAGGAVASLRRVAAIARNTFREAVRDKVLYNLVLFALLLTGVAIFLSDLTAAEEYKLIADLGLSATLLFGLFISVFVGVGLVYKEIERRTLYAIFAKPVGRGEFLLGKYLGLCATILLNVAVMGSAVTVALLYVRRPHDPSAFAVWPAVLLIFAELTVVTAVAIFFSSFSSPALSALLAFLVTVVGHFSGDLKAFAEALGSGAARYAFGTLYYLLPNLSQYGHITAAGHGHTPEPATAANALLYALVYDAVLLAAAAIVFKRRNFK